MNIALIEPYYGGSHQAWADGYAESSAHSVRLIAHPARFWKWRMHGAHLTLAEHLGEQVRSGWVPDVILASSMMDVAAFTGAIRGFCPETPIATYFHESQFTYPLSPADKVDFTYQMKNWGSAAVSDLVIFNSDYHKSVFFAEARAFLNAFPEDKHVHMIDPVMDEAIVRPVGVDLGSLLARPTKREGAPLVMWNQRWEHDKGPEELLAIVKELVASGLDFTMAMCGEVFVSVPSTFAEVEAVLGDRLIHAGFAPRSEYETLLSSSTVVLSTARQEFFGIAIVEAIAAGAFPVLPQRLVYPERIKQLDLDPAKTLFDDPTHAVRLVTSALDDQIDSDALRTMTAQYDWTKVAPSYDAAIEGLVNRT